MELGYPDLPKVSSSIIIPDDKKMSFNIIRSEFTDYENINVVPSKGNLSNLLTPIKYHLVLMKVITRYILSRGYCSTKRAIHIKRF